MAVVIVKAGASAAAGWWPGLRARPLTRDSQARDNGKDQDVGGLSGSARISFSLRRAGWTWSALMASYCRVPKAVDPLYQPGRTVSKSVCGVGADRFGR